ncbi:hypothetical protein [uncultured Aquimarina sp.]|uniref:DUF7660 family protein n=1 Tax=uncultured Aquimarina sp. TaxID=575652 RepID=UPI00261FBD18|nr:hypothetical protein [uncultured Aquimarina sp.]
MIVNTKKDFIQFVQELREDSANWENKDTDSFFEALGRYTEDIQNFYDNTEQNVNSENASWKVFADILKGASIYE